MMPFSSERLPPFSKTKFKWLKENNVSKAFCGFMAKYVSIFLSL